MRDKTEYYHLPIQDDIAERPDNLRHAHVQTAVVKVFTRSSDSFIVRVQDVTATTAQ